MSAGDSSVVVARARDYLRPVTLVSIAGGPLEVIPKNVRSNILHDDGRAFSVKVVATNGLLVTLAIVRRTGLGCRWQFNWVLRELASLQDRTIGNGKTVTMKAEAARAVSRTLARLAREAEGESAAGRMLGDESGESGWVVERTNPGTGVVIYIAGLRALLGGRDFAEQTIDSFKALRFSRETDAKRFAADIERCGLVSDRGWRAVQHMWDTTDGVRDVTREPWMHAELLREHWEPCPNGANCVQRWTRGGHTIVIGYRAPSEASMGQEYFMTPDPADLKVTMYHTGLETALEAAEILADGDGGWV